MVMVEKDWMVERFQANRDHLQSVAYRMLGSESEAEDAVQETWIRLSRSDTSAVENLGGWLTTVTARVCLDMLRSRKSRREHPLQVEAADSKLAGLSPAPASDPADEAILADSIGPALLVVLDTLAPAERLAFVLHDMFAMPFEDIAPIVKRTPTASRQLASRARRRVQGGASEVEADVSRERSVVEAFLNASRNGDFEALIAVLDPEVVLHSDDASIKGAEANKQKGAPALAPEIKGAPAVVEILSGRALGAEIALIDGMAGAVWAYQGAPRLVFAFTTVDDRVVEIDIVADRTHVKEMQIELLA
jgi:RNA polymerase sigma factor (sigma-70 family)